MDIGEAIGEMRRGERVRRSGWNNDRSIGLLDPGSNAQMTRPYLFEDDGNGKVVPWCASHGELLADDWQVV